MKKLLAILLTAMLLLGLAACKDDTYTDEDNKEMILVVQFVGEDETKEYPSLYVGELTVEAIAMGLSELTGLRFDVTTLRNDGGSLTVDWSYDSTLFTGPSEEQNEGDFPFGNYDSLVWFMLDSLDLSVKRNLPDIKDIYYTVDGGNALVLDLFDPLTIPPDAPYMGSEWHLAHWDGIGDIIDEDPVDPDDVNWEGEYGSENGMLYIADYDGKSFRFTFDDDGVTREGTAALDPETAILASAEKYEFRSNLEQGTISVWFDGGLAVDYVRTEDAVG